MKLLIGTVIGFLLANVFHFVEIGMMTTLMKDIKQLLNQLKQEGDQDKWLK